MFNCSVFYLLEILQCTWILVIFYQLVFLSILHELITIVFRKFASFIESHSTPNGMVHQYNSSSSINIPESRFTVKGYTKGGKFYQNSQNSIENMVIFIHPWVHYHSCHQIIFVFQLFGKDSIILDGSYNLTWYEFPLPLRTKNIVLRPILNKNRLCIYEDLDEAA